jgi:hypothetical protein
MKQYPYGTSGMCTDPSLTTLPSSLVYQPVKGVPEDRGRMVVEKYNAIVKMLGRAPTEAELISMTYYGEASMFLAIKDEKLQMDLNSTFAIPISKG